MLLRRCGVWLLWGAVATACVTVIGLCSVVVHDARAVRGYAPALCMTPVLGAAKFALESTALGMASRARVLAYTSLPGVRDFTANHTATLQHPPVAHWQLVLGTRADAYRWATERVQSYAPCRLADTDATHTEGATDPFDDAGFVGVLVLNCALLCATLAAPFAARCAEAPSSPPPQPPDAALVPPEIS